MTASLDWSRWLGALVALFAIPVGVLAGIDPKFAIFAALGLAFVVIAFSDLAAGLSIFTFLGFVEVVSVGGAAKIAGLLLALSWFALIATTPRAEHQFLTVHPLMSAVIGLFLGWALLSSTWAEAPDHAVTAASRYALNALLFLIIFTAIRTPKQLGWVLLAFTVGAAVAAIAGIASPPTTADGGSAATSSTQTSSVQYSSPASPWRWPSSRSTGSRPCGWLESRRDSSPSCRSG